MRPLSLILAGTALALSAPTLAASAPAGTPAADMRAFARTLSIPYEQFTLPNGLKVLVHTDRSTPMVAVSVWYNVGAKYEPKGRSGFAHLFEHLMFNGSENVPGDFFKPLQEAGAIGMNGTTSQDRTNYYETVPTAALDRTLFMESDRMGHLLGGISQAVLDEQRGVVQNEKRQGEDNPYSIVSDRLTTTLFPATHPYGHTVIGSMADLDAADLGDVRGWFRNHYGPNNALLVLAGDIDVPTAKALVTKYFGDIPAGPANVAPTAPVPTLPARVEETVTAPISAPLIVRAWAVPGYQDVDGLGLDAVMGLMTQIDDALLERVLVRERRLFDSVNANNNTLAQGGTFSVQGRVAKGVDPAIAARALDELLASFLKNGPTADEVTRWVTNYTVNYARGLEPLDGRAEALAQGVIYTGDPNAYRRDLGYYTSLTPQMLTTLARRWLGRPAYALTVNPGPRIAERTTDPTAAPPGDAQEAPLPARVARMAMPGVGEPRALRFPQVEHDRLSNGIELIYAPSSNIPFTHVTLSFDSGVTVDPADRIGRQEMMFSALDKGIAGHDARWIEARKERLGISLGAGAGMDDASVRLSTPSINLTPGLELLGQVVRQPTFPTDEVDRLKRDALTMIGQEKLDPSNLILRTLPRLMNANSPYVAHQGFGDPAVIPTLTPADLAAAHALWLRPEHAKIFIVSDRPLTELKPAIEAEFGRWTGTGSASGRPPVVTPPAPAQPQIVLIDRKDSAQATISGGQQVEKPTPDEQLPLDVANSALGGGFLSRINMNLREDKHWSYGASGNFLTRDLEATYTVDAAVQQDKAGPALAEMRKEVNAFLTTRPMTMAELDLVRGGTLRSMAGWFQSGMAVLNAMQENDRYGRPDDYYVTLADRYRKLNLTDLNARMRRTLQPATWVWTVVGDAAVVKPQLDPLGLPVRVIPADAVIPATPAAAR